MAVDDLDAFAEDNGSEDREEGEDRWEGGFAVNNEEGHVVDFQAIGEISHACSSLVRVSDDDHFMASVDEFAG